MLKDFARIMANFPVLGMRPHLLLPHTVRLCVIIFDLKCIMPWTEQELFG